MSIAYGVNNANWTADQIAQWKAAASKIVMSEMESETWRKRIADCVFWATCCGGGQQIIIDSTTALWDALCYAAFKREDEAFTHTTGGGPMATAKLNYPDAKRVEIPQPDRIDEYPVVQMRTRRVPQPPKVEFIQQRPTVTLEISLEAAETLRMITGSVVGSSLHSRRRYTDEVWNALVGMGFGPGRYEKDFGPYLHATDHTIGPDYQANVPDNLNGGQGVPTKVDSGQQKAQAARPNTYEGWAGVGYKTPNW